VTQLVEHLTTKDKALISKLITKKKKKKKEKTTCPNKEFSYTIGRIIKQQNLTKFWMVLRKLKRKTY
jgi:hypothetical protein